MFSVPLLRQAFSTDIIFKNDQKIQGFWSVAWMTRLTLATVSTLGIVLAPSIAQAQRNFTPRFGAQVRGRTTMFGNPVTTCSTTLGARAGLCANRRQAINGNGIEFTNNGYYIDYVDIDGDASTFNSSSVTYNFPTANPGFNVVWAGLYWAGATSAGGATGGTAGVPAIDANKRNQMLLKTPGSAAYQTITASTVDDIGSRYSAFANVTNLVQQGGSGTYTGANIQTGKGSDRYGGWVMIVVYEDSTEILRSMTVFDGFLTVGNNVVTTTIGGFLTPNAGPFESAIGFFTSEGDLGLQGDQFLLDGDGNNSDGDAVDQPFKNVGDTASPQSNFFNSSAALFDTRIGSNTTVNTPDGKVLGSITRNPDFPNLFAMDIDVVEAADAAGNTIMQNNATSAGLQFTSTGDFYYPTAFFFSVEVFQPVLTQNFTKTVTDINGGDLRVGDILEYTITYQNTGNDDAVDVVLKDDIPVDTTYEPNSLVITTDPDPALATPASMGDGTADGDRAEFDSANNRVVFRSGIGADGTNGGRVPFDNPATPVAENDTVQVKFRVKVNSNITSFPRTISNQAEIDYEGAFSGTPFSGVSDDPTTPNDPSDPTDIVVTPLLDFGDAPDTYGTDVTANNSSNGTDPVGASHVIVSGIHLGSTPPDFEADAAAPLDGTGDGADEDGVTIPASIVPGDTISLPVSVTGNGVLNAWIDWNGNGTFDAGEQIATDVVDGGTGDADTTGDGTITLSITAPGTATVGNTYARFRYSLSTETSLGPTGAAQSGEVEDYAVVIGPNEPNLLLIKRITRVNGLTTNGSTVLNAYIDDPSSPYDDNTLDTPAPTPMDTQYWPTLSTFLTGAIDGGVTRPDDEIEYTIYFLSTGDTAAVNVKLCDKVPSFQTFVSDTFNALPPAPSGGVGANRGISVEYNGSVLSYTNDADGDTAEYFPPGSALPAACSNAPAQAEDNGAIVVNLGTLPQATSPGTPTTSYGAVRFRAKVK